VHTVYRTHARSVKAVVDAIAHAFDVVALAWGEDHPVAEKLSALMHEAARLAVESAQGER